MSTGEPHDSAAYHVTGQSQFVDDRPALPGEVHVACVLATEASARIVGFDASTATQMEGVFGVFRAGDLACNHWGTIFHDQPLLAADRVNYHGEVIALVAAATRELAEAARRQIRVAYEREQPVLTIAEARRSKDFIGPVRTIATGAVDEALRSAPHRLKGTIRMAGQDHFYLESQAAIAYPLEGDTIEVHCSSQHPTETQHLIAEALGLKLHQVVTVVRRMGGAFGGKESQAAPFAVYAALVASRLRRPARVVLSKDDDMIITGKRNPFANDYEVGFDEQGRILALRADLYSDAGAYADLSTAIMERAMLHIDNAYYIPNLKVTGTVCRTNNASNTAFRGFGGPKGVLTIESIIQDIAKYLGIDAFDIRQRNVYRPGSDRTHYGQKIADDTLATLFTELRSECRYDERRAAVDAHNATNAVTLRGLAATAVKFGISFTTRFLNQGSALVNVHLDGTVQVSTGATEMGQGVNSKIAAVVAEVFGIPTDDVRVMPTSTEKNHNTSPTAASSGSDINAGAAEIAARKIRKRLALVFEQLLSRSDALRGRVVAGAGTAAELRINESADEPDFVFEDGRVFRRDNPDQSIPLPELLQEAYLNRVALGDYGFFRYEGIHFNKETGQGEPFFYFTNGVACSEVAIDRFTGELKVLRTDLIMDLGRPINEGIDTGQVVGAFVQGMGWATTESLYYADSGALISHSPSTYKIPSVHDIPREFNVRLLEGQTNDRNVRGSKAVGEPPLLLGLSVWAAAKDALGYLHDAGKTVALDLPATGETLLMAMTETAP